VPAEFVANDKPLLIRYDHSFYFPILNYYTEKQFGGDLEILCDYRDPVVQKLIEAKGFMIWPLVRFSYETVDYSVQKTAPSPPAVGNWLGTDDQGRDVFARVIYGFRISVLFGLILTIISSLIGILAGAVQGYFGGRLDLWAQRGMEIWGSMPRLYILIIFSSMFIPGFLDAFGHLVVV